MSTHEKPDDAEPDAATTDPALETTSEGQNKQADDLRTLADRMTRIAHRAVHLIAESADVIVVHIIALSTIDQATHLLQLALR